MKKIMIVAVILVTVTIANAQWIRSANTDVVINTNKNLMWQDTVSTIVDELDWSGAMSYCSNLSLAGFDNWRLPDVETLKSLYLDKANLSHVAKNYYWSSSVDDKGSARSWIVGFNMGDSSNFARSDTNLVRCVRDHNASLQK